ncbi:MAG: hypothetical protein DBP02_10125 [gamma proteobacterium symbiont of Ctena orbiculata]|nr:MAG: hypothetical protein DBP02_10125 [gamma proteobacterium symbiont of Ctena orbiculata]
MVHMHKFIIGIRPSTKMFRIQSIGGQVVDAVLDLRGSSVIPDDFYTKVSNNTDGMRYQIHSEDFSNVLMIDRENIVFIKDTFSSGEEIDVSKSLREFTEIWKALDLVTRVRGIRRIGIAAEHLLEYENPSAELIRNLTKIEPPPHTGKFYLKYEDRRPTRESISPDIEKDDYINVIISAYDSILDVDHKEPGTANVNIDVQRYFQPLLNKLSYNDFEKILKHFSREREGMFQKLAALGITTDE